MDVTTQAGGPSAGANGFAGQSDAGAGGVTGSASSTDTGQSERADQPRGNPEAAAGVQSPQNGGLAKVFAGQSDAGAGGVTGSANNTDTGQSEHADQPRGNPETPQSNDSLNFPAWFEQLPVKLRTKLAAEPDSLAKLTAYKNVEDLVQAHLDTPAQTGKSLPAVPGKDSDPAEVQAFYESLGKPKEAAGYPFAKDSPDFAAAAFAANLSAGQADALFKASLAQMDDARKGIQAALAQDFQATDALLQKEYGDKYGEATVLLQRGLGNNPQTGELSPVAQSLVNAGLAGKPEIVRAFIELGKATSEGTAPSGSFKAGMPQSVMDGRGFTYN